MLAQTMKAKGLTNFDHALSKINHLNNSADSIFFCIVNLTDAFSLKVA